MIVAEKLTKHFEDFVAVDEVSLQVNAGEVLALLGPNGAGKTTTVRMLTSVLKPTRGWARVAGFDVVEHPNKVRATVGILTEQHGLYERMTAEEYLLFFSRIYGLSADIRPKRIQQLLDQFGITPYARRRIGHYSKGMRQKLALVRALIHDPQVLLLDEPTSAMDPESARLVRDSLHDLRSAQRAILVCTHNLPEAEELADKIAIIQLGRIIAMGTSAELKQALLGSPEYEIRLATRLNGRVPDLPAQAVLTSQGPDWLHYRSDNPEQINPQVLAALIAQGFPVVSLAEIPRSLERVYLQAVSQAEKQNGETQAPGRVAHV